AAGAHDGLLVAAGPGVIEHAPEAAEIPGDARPAESVVKGRRTRRRLDQDVQRADNAVGLGHRAYPGLLESGDAQVGDRVADQSRLRLGARPRRTLVADLATGARGGTGERRDRRRVVVGLHLHQDVDGLLVRAVHAGVRIGEITAALRALDHRGIVLVG